MNAFKASKDSTIPERDWERRGDMQAEQQGHFGDSEAECLHFHSMLFLLGQRGSNLCLYYSISCLQVQALGCVWAAVAD